MKLIIINFIKIYQRYISIWLGKNCIYIPTCSQYMINAIKNYGIFKGLIFSIKRIINCNPFNNKY